jgi:hypothetical protein
MAASAGSSKGSRWDGCLLLEALEGRPGSVMSVSNEAIVATHSTQLLTESGILFGTALNVGWPQANNANFHSPKLKMAMEAIAEHPLCSSRAASVPSGGVALWTRPQPQAPRRRPAQPRARASSREAKQPNTGILKFEP